MLIEVNDAGEVVLPAAVVRSPPHTRLDVDRQGDVLIIKPIVAEVLTGESFWSHFPKYPAAPADPGMTFRREDIYDDTGR